MGLRFVVTLIFILSFVKKDVFGNMVSMKIVDEPSSYGLSNSFGGLYQSQEDKLQMRVHPANFSGPAHLKRLVGKCFSLVDNSYKYEFCPFYNVTQHEQSLRWNPYSGVLGGYQEWEIENNTFHAMVMREGDACGEIFRSVKVFFRCSNHSHVTKVSEPHTCQYHMDFLTPLVCHNHSMLVYPTLARELQGEWDRVEGELVREEITQQGYKKKLRKIFEDAGYYLSKEKHKILSKVPEIKKEEPAKPVEEPKGEFSSMQKCTEEVTKLREELAQLKEGLLVRGIKEFELSNNKGSRLPALRVNSPIQDHQNVTTIRNGTEENKHESL
ncbi:N-acetylglucosamine-1-phosphotransferase subunit gamma-like isoform X1 [Haliotis cracherodii]|uniref:N-acetylglucosamine-1-phosphotransferase subunit gamma-like isoform X1 n=1 Tax=Haliotis cracherodii TaxID=6455 RepID=UPI0039E8E753